KTINYNQSGFKLIKKSKRLDLLRLSKIGNIPIRVHRLIEGKMKQVIIKRHNSGKWFACICVEKEVNVVKRDKKIKMKGWVALIRLSRWSPYWLLCQQALSLKQEAQGF
ncbi:MAG: hypothetical protein QXG01_05700, partial [Candidatus Bathyarchaeia archaeon]